MQDFLNTIDIESETDLIASPDALAAWMAEKGLVDGATRLPVEEHP